MNEIRNMDGVFYRVCRDGKWMNLCFSDMTLEEREQQLESADTNYLKRLCNILADTLYGLGVYFERED